MVLDKKDARALAARYDISEQDVDWIVAHIESVADLKDMETRMEMDAEMDVKVDARELGDLETT